MNSLALNLLKPSAEAKKREEKWVKKWKTKKREESKTPKSKHKLISFL
ncbi:hypothetical protein DESME_03830 [Desulfitobacterium metallireducens DSM 15288]|uniref:Uncharacterized protein n=1 Tax=Desulfitobacterium metallireducens DSM 15288 TaxID=871968 RepID=W0EG14_9FIRM|nr:hypothetical protein DESME_03830 [Desulfitobacterium metallireducens DSM 15288]